MKLFLSTLFLCMLALTSCATDKIGLRYKFSELDVKINSDIGFLRIYTSNHIYTSNYKEKGEYVDDPVYNVYKGYTIYNSNGEYGH